MLDHSPVIVAWKYHFRLPKIVWKGLKTTNVANCPRSRFAIGKGLLPYVHVVCIRYFKLNLFIL